MCEWTHSHCIFGQVYLYNKYEIVKSLGGYQLEIEYLLCFYYNTEFDKSLYEVHIKLSHNFI
jgi:hypothetical protein